jgi:chorismate dehydratase
MARVRLGAVGYLNARPLVYGLEQSPRFDLRFDVPSRCAALLHEGAIDLGLVPSIEYLRGPEPYWIVPGPAIASRGPVASVLLYTTRPISDVRTIALDTSSRTSVALVRVLCAREFGIAPTLVPHGPDLHAMLTVCDAALVIGDLALFEASQVEKIDLGEAWTKATGLPFVYAFWAGREGRVTTADVRAIQQARDEGSARPRDVAHAYFPDDPVRQDIATRYLRDNIRYHLGAEERDALERFYQYAAEAGVVAAADGLLFYGDGDQGPGRGGG